MRRDTELLALGRPLLQDEGGINLPVYRASTIVYPNLESYEQRLADGRQYDKIVYGSAGTQNARAYAEAVTRLEGGHRSVVTSSGLAAVTLAISACASAGDHVLVADSVYAPTRSFCTTTLARFGVATSFFDAGDPEQILSLARPSTRLIFLESPSSWRFDVYDVPKFVRHARALGLLVLVDNTWATPLYFRPLSLGADVVIHAGTKYLSGHSDVVIGTITARNQELFHAIADQVMSLGDVASPDECALALRGLRTLSVRLERQARSALEIARWLETRKEVRRVLYPALPSHPGHELWKRDFLGASSLFGVEFARSDAAALQRMVNNLEFFRIGSSYGGYASLVSVAGVGAANAGSRSPSSLRLHIGLEDPDDLMEDLAAGLARLGV